LIDAIIQPREIRDVLVRPLRDVQQPAPISIPASCKPDSGSQASLPRNELVWARARPGFQTWPTDFQPVAPAESANQTRTPIRER
jgi:hypothetical protein